MTDIQHHVVNLLHAIAKHQRAQAAWHQTRIERARRDRTTCEGCGCLVWPWEHCPGCQARRQAREEAA